MRRLPVVLALVALTASGAPGTLGETASGPEVSFAEDWEDGLASWRMRGSWAVQDCTRGVSGCSLRLITSCCNKEVEASRGLDVPLNGPTAIAFSAWSDHPSYRTAGSVIIRFDNEDEVRVRLAQSRSGLTNTALFVNGVHYSGSWLWEAGRWGSLHVMVDPEAATVSLVTDLGVSVMAPLRSAPTGVSRLSFMVDTHGSLIDTIAGFNFDSVRISRAVPAVEDFRVERGNQSVVLTWRPPPEGEVTSYRAYWHHFGTGSPLHETPETAWELATAPGTWRDMTVVAWSPDGPSLQSPIVSNRSFFAPGPPENVEVYAGPARGTVTLCWSWPTDHGEQPLSGFRIERGQPYGGYWRKTDVGLVTSTAIQDDEPLWRIRAASAAGLSPASGAVSPSLPVPPAPVPMVSIRAEGDSLLEGSLHWIEAPTRSCVPVEGYRVYRVDGASGAQIEIAETDRDARELRVPALAPHAPNRFAVAAFNWGGESQATHACLAPTRGPAPHVDCDWAVHPADRSPPD